MRSHLILLAVAAAFSGGVLAAEANEAGGINREKKPAANADKAANYLEGFNCGTGKTGWVRAKAVTPNLVPPCNTGSGGLCEPASFVYVPGTGWCRPR
jgi:hypothetical protein